MVEVEWCEISSNEHESSNFQAPKCQLAVRFSCLVHLSAEQILILFLPHNTRYFVTRILNSEKLCILLFSLFGGIWVSQKQSFELLEGEVKFTGNCPAVLDLLCRKLTNYVKNGPLNPYTQWSQMTWKWALLFLKGA